MLAAALLAIGLGSGVGHAQQAEDQLPTAAFLGRTRLRGFGVSVGMRFGLVRRASHELIDTKNDWVSPMAQASQMAPRIAAWSEIGGDVWYGTLGLSYQPGRQPMDHGFLVDLMRDTQLDVGLNADLYDVDLGLRSSVSLWSDSIWRPMTGVRIASIQPPEIGYPGAEIILGVQSDGLPQVMYNIAVDTPYLVPYIDEYMRFRDPEGSPR